jgi:Ca2+-binding EF-hand superfamily protein
MTKPKSLLAFCALLASGLQAQPGRGSYIQFHPLLSALDTNRDGVIDEAELARAPGILRSLDRNADGRITPDEMAPARRREDGPPREDSVEEVVKTYLAFDKNGDGKLTKDELPERMQGIFDRADTNKDGFLTADELRALARAQHPAGAGRGEREGRGGRGPGMTDPIFAALDTNHDNVIDADEIANAASSLKKLDKNNDGKLTEDEVRPNFPGRGRQ